MTLLLLGLLVLIVAATALISARPTIHAPARARQGAVITVTATHLRSGSYSLLLVTDRAPHDASYCVATLSAARTPRTEERFVVHLPDRIPCFRGAPPVTAGSVTATGDDELMVAVQTRDGVSDRYSAIHRSLRIA